MIEDREIWACAHHLIRQYGDAAAFHAAQRADEMLANTDFEGHRTWLRVLRSINALEAAPPPSAQLN